MRETRADTAQALGLALLLHALIAVLLFAGLWWTRAAAPAAAAGSMAAEVVAASDLSAAMRRTLRNRPEPVKEPLPEPEPEPVEDEAEPLPQPVPEPKPQDAPTPQQTKAQDFIPQPDEKNQQAVVDAPTPKPAEEKKVQEAKRKQEQVDLTEQRERQEEAQRQQRLSALEQERLKQLADIRKRRTAAQREAELAEQKLRQIADARAQSASNDAAAADATVGNSGNDSDLRARYAAALAEAIRSKWTRPDSVPTGARCRIIIRQVKGGEVLSAEVSQPCAYDELGQRSIEAAVLKAQPLPYAGFEAVFQRELTLNFIAED